MVDLGGVKSFAAEKFWRPLAQEGVFYNPYNTAVYALLFGLGAYYIGLPLVRRMDMELDRKFFAAIAPFILLGGSLRSVRDAGVFDTVLLVSPLIYIVMFVLVVSVLAVSRLAERYTRMEYWKPAAAAGGALFVGSLGAFRLANSGALLYTGLLLLLSVGLLWLAVKNWRPELATPAFLVPVATHYFDASTSVTSIMYGGVEKHVLAGFFIDLMGPLGMFAMKTLVVVPATYLILSDTEGDEQKFLLFVVALLGLALGTRNLVSTVGI